jgi:hypothetical protein
MFRSYAVEKTEAHTLCTVVFLRKSYFCPDNNKKEIYQYVFELAYSKVNHHSTITVKKRTQQNLCRFRMALK